MCIRVWHTFLKTTIRTSTLRINMSWIQMIARSERWGEVGGRKGDGEKRLGGQTGEKRMEREIP